jgi:hypothetical protein
MKQQDNIFFFIVRFFKKKKKKKKKIKIRKRKFMRFRRFRRFRRFKKLRKHIKVFKLKKLKKRKVSQTLFDSNYLYFYNYFNRYVLSKNFVLKNTLMFRDISTVLVGINTFIQFKHLLKNIPCNTVLSNFTFFFVKVSFLKLSLNLNKNKKRFKNIFLKNTLNKKINKNLFIKKYFIKIRFFKRFLIQNIKWYNLYFFYTSTFLVKDNFFTRKEKFLKKIKKYRWKKKRFFIKNKLFRKKKQTRWKRRRYIFKKINSQKQTTVFKKEVYKIFIYNLLNFSKFNPNFFINVASFYWNPAFLKKKNFMKKRFRKKLVLFNFLRLKNIKPIFLYNNYFPIYNSNRFLIKRFKKIFKSFFLKKYFNSLQYYVIAFFERFLSKKFFIKSVNYNFFKKKKYKKRLKFYRIYKIFIKNKHSVLSKKNRFNLIEILEIILFSFYSKDLFLLKNWFLRNFRKLHHKNQKNFLSLFKVLITDVFETYRSVFGIKGFYFIIKGKVGVTSNAKKKRILFRIGPLNKSSKNQKIDFQQGVVKASSGSSGLLMILTYR